MKTHEISQVSSDLVIFHGNRENRRGNHGNRRGNVHGNHGNSIKNEFLSEEILVEDIDYYYSNVISRASTTMTQCRNEKLNLKKNGTEG